MSGGIAVANTPYRNAITKEKVNHGKKIDAKLKKGIDDILETDYDATKKAKDLEYIVDEKAKSGYTKEQIRDLVGYIQYKNTDVTVDNIEDELYQKPKIKPTIEEKPKNVPEVQPEREVVIAGEKRPKTEIIQPIIDINKLNPEQKEQYQDMIEKYGQKRADELITSFLPETEKYIYTPEEYQQKIKEETSYAKRNESLQMRKESTETGKEQTISDKDLPEFNRIELQNRENVKEEKEIIPEKGIKFKNKIFETEEQIKESLSKDEITAPEYNQAIEQLNKRNFDDAKERLRENLDKLFTKQAIGEESAKLTDLYDSMVDFIKQAVKLYGDKIKSAKDIAKYANVKYNKILQNAYNEAIGKKVLLKEDKMRGFPKRIKEFQEFKDIKIDIEENPELYYKPQSLKEGKEKLEQLSNEELVQKVTDLTNLKLSEQGDNLGVLAGIELINRYRTEGKDVMPVIENISKAGTAMGQLIRQYGELKGSTPEGMVNVVEKNLEKANRYLTQEQRDKLTDLADKDIKARQLLKDQGAKTKILFTEDNINQYNKLKKEAEDSYIKLAQYIQIITPKKFWDIMGMTLQGNLLTPMSQITNIYANLMNIPLTSASNTIAAPIDVLHTIITGKTRETTISPKVVLEGIKGFGYGLKEAGKQIVTGVPIQEKAELTRGFQPLRSLQQAFSGKDMPVDIKGKIPVKDRVNKFIEGTVGIPAESMFRLLNLGDKPFYRMGERMALYRIAKNKNLRKDELEKFIMFPDSKSSKKAEEAAREITFQEESTTAKAAQNITGTLYKTVSDIPIVGGGLKFLLKTQMPYVRTPANIISQTLDFAVPPISLGKSVYYAYKGDKRNSLVNIGKAGVGIMIGLAAEELLRHDIISGSPDEEKKKRNLQYEILPPNSINISALDRLIKGEDTSPKKGDNIINYSKMGIVGMTLGVHANIYKRKQQIKQQQQKYITLNKDQKKLSENSTNILSAILEIPSYALEQSFLKGTSSLLTAINDKQWDYWLTNTFNAISSVPLPNTLTSINRSINEYIPDLKGDNIEERLGNVIRNKLFMTEDLPLIINMWGEPIKQTPEGNKKWLYQLFDVTKHQELITKPESKFIYDLYKKTEDADIIPPVPTKTITINNKSIRLDSKQYEYYLRETGKMRYNLLKLSLTEDKFINTTDENKIKYLKKIWDKGQKYGKIATLLKYLLENENKK
jgi:hypothetical protein